MPPGSVAAKLLKLPPEELERTVALRYEEGLIALQKRMHPEAADHPLPEGVVILGRPSHPAKPGEGETPEELALHGRKVVEAMFEAVRDEVCQDRAEHPREFARPSSAVARLVGHVTRASPPDEMFVAAACLLYRQGLAAFCAKRAEAPT